MNVEKLESDILAKGNEIRDMKKSGATKSSIQPRVESLLSLKSQYKQLTGRNYGEAAKSVKAVPNSKNDADGGSQQKHAKKSKNQLKKEKKKAAAALKKQDKKVTKSKASTVKKSVTGKSSSPDAATPDHVRILRDAVFWRETANIVAGSEQTVTPWDVEAENGVDYDKLILQFGCSAHRSRYPRRV